jgi:hypothetical protein
LEKVTVELWTNDLNAKIKQENESNEGGTVSSVRKVRLKNCIASKNASKKSA